MVGLVEKLGSEKDSVTIGCFGISMRERRNAAPASDLRMISC